MTYIAYEGEGRDGYRDQIVTSDVGVSLHFEIHPLFMKYSIIAQAHSVMHTSIRACFLCFFYNPYMSLFRIFYLLVSTLFLLIFMFITRSFLANLKLN